LIESICHVLLIDVSLHIIKISCYYKFYLNFFRETGWSGGESGSIEYVAGMTCAEEKCTENPLPCGRYCLSHVTLAPEQRLYAACAAVFAGGSRCKQPLLPLQDQTPLCPEHAWKRVRIHFYVQQPLGVFYEQYSSS
jgi:hypothetical protein